MEYFDSFSPTSGDRDVISQVERLSSGETKMAPTTVPTALCSGTRSFRISYLLWGSVGETSPLPAVEQSANPPLGIFLLVGRPEVCGCAPVSGSCLLFPAVGERVPQFVSVCRA